ncbi:MAG: helix-turn-helix domain-containing protein [Planctomycetota bacterium]
MKGWGRIPKWWLTRLPELCGAERGVAIVLAAHANRDWQCWPSVELMATYSGCAERTVQRALRGLEQKGLIRMVSLGGGRSLASVYQLRNTDTGGGVLMKQKVTTSSCKRRHDMTVKGDVQTAPTKRGTEIQQQQVGPAAAAGDETGEMGTSAMYEHMKVTRVLDAAGIHDPKKRILVAGIPCIELVIDEMWKEARSGRNPAGLLLTKVDKDAQSRIAAAKHRLNQQPTAGSHRPAATAETEQRHAVWNGLTETEREKWREKAKERLGACDRERPIEVDARASTLAWHAAKQKKQIDDYTEPEPGGNQR